MPAHKSIIRFILTAILLYGVLLAGWSYCVRPYIGMVTPLANRELRIMGVEDMTRLGPSNDPNFEVAVYHRDAADMQDSLFDFKLESFRSHIPMLVALILAMPLRLKRRLKATVAGLALIYLIDSVACIVIMTWSYTFLPDQHKFTPFADSFLRDHVVSFLYNFYNAIGVGFIPVIIWILVSVRRADLQRFFPRDSGETGTSGAKR